MSLLPELSSPYSLRDEQVAEYRRNGHALLRGICSQEEVAAYCPVIREAMIRQGKLQQQKKDETDDAYARAFTQRINLWTIERRVERLVRSKRFARIAARLSGAKSIRLYRDQALCKEPGSGPTPWHQDQYYWPFDTQQAVTIWLALTDISVDMGPMKFASGSHLGGDIGGGKITEGAQSYFNELVGQRGFEVTEPVALFAGDATLHNGWMLHCANGNLTNRPREAMTITYIADGTRIEQPTNDNQRMDLEAFLPDQEPGELVGSRLNPVLLS